MFLEVTLYTALLIIIILLIKRLKSSMAALVAWIVGSITGSRTAEEDKDNTEADKSTKSNNKSPSRGRPKKKSDSKEPTFSTTLTTPIEEIIEETLIEEHKEESQELAAKATGKPRKRNRPTKTRPKSQEQEKDDVGFSFFKTRSSDSFYTNKDDRKVTKSDLEEFPNSNASAVVDPVGFSFIPVKDKRSKRGQRKVDDLPKSTLIEHFQPKKRKRPTDSQISLDKVEKKDNLVEIVNKQPRPVVYFETKESQKVNSKVSYASVTSQSFEESLKQIQSREEIVNNHCEESQKLLIDSNYFGESTEEDKKSLVEDFVDVEESLQIIDPTDKEVDIRFQVKKETSLFLNEEIYNNKLEQERVDHNNFKQTTHPECISLPTETFTQVEEHIRNTVQECLENNLEGQKIQIAIKVEESVKFNGNETNEEITRFESIENTKITNLFQSSAQKIEQTSKSSIEVVETPKHPCLYETENVRPDPLIEKPFKMSSGTQVRVLTLNDKEHQESTLYRIEKNWVLQFRLGPPLLGRKVSLHCNYPKENEKYSRNSYQLLEWVQDEGCDHADDTALLTEIVAQISGSFHYYFTYENGERQGSGFFLVDPVLKYGKGESLALDCIQCQTVLAKSLGPFDTWESKLRVAKESGYNMIHFTPVQELGASNSSYSISDQLKVNPLFTKQNGDATTFEDINQLINKLRTEWKVTSICDIVLNHVANESHWLEEHPEVTYNCANCAYMRPSYLLDAALYKFSLDVAKGDYEDKGIPVQVCTEEHLNSIRYYLQSEIAKKIKIHEMYTCDVNKCVSEFLSLARNKVTPETLSSDNEELVLIQDPLYRRLASTIDMKLALKLYNVYRADCFDEETRIKRCGEDFKNRVDALNKKITDEINDHLNAAVANSIAGIRYFRVQHDGPRIQGVSKKNPLVFRYFTDYGNPTSVKEHEDLMYSDKGRFLMAHNGWVMNSDPLRNFAAPGSNVYVRRELIAWGDSVKLRYGDKPEDCPYLWNHMRMYVEQTATIFDGVRLDNCHSTPIAVAEYLLDCARQVRPDLYVVAELFTNSDMTDNIFVNRLGITSLIREAMSAWDSHEQGRLVYRYGGCPVGSFYQPRVRPLVPSIAHALFLDLTHDNPSPVEKRSVFDLLPSTGLVNMACCASGSSRGYDEIVPHHIHVVDETRLYTEWANDGSLALGNLRYVTNKSGIIAAKRALNELHYLLGAEGFNQVYVDQMDPDIVAVTRHCPETHESYVMVAFTAFGHPPEDADKIQRAIKPLRVEGVLDEIVLEATLTHIGAKSSGSKYKKFEDFVRDSKWINGLSEYQVEIKQHIQPKDSGVFEQVDSGSASVVQLDFKNFKPGSLAVIRVSLPHDMCQAVKKVRDLIRQFSVKKDTELSKIIAELALADLNRALYRCDQEERDEGHGFDTYDIPNFGRIVYAGFQGFMSLLADIRPSNDLGHPMCGNLRDGNWMIDYIWQRLKLDEGTKRLGQWLEENSKSLTSIPRYLIPCYFDVIVTGVYILLLEQTYNKMSDFVKHGSTFVKGLSLGSVQFGAYIISADLPLLSPNLSDPQPPHRKNAKGELTQACVSLSAGLPHFAVGYMRNWGRDTFIALRGLFMLTGRYQEARYHILGYAACLRHGLIPNLLDGGRNPRFNCRDAIWWWLYCIKCYVEDAPNGSKILSDKVSRIFPQDDSVPQPAGAVDQPLCDVIQEALNTHFQGLVFRERNAGRQIDEHMTDHGFNNQIGVHPETGFVFGGNSHNCGTWMDKMGSSDKAGIKGKPATPRDGSAVELIGLSKACVSWLAKLNEEGLYPYSSVKRTHKNGNVTAWTYKEWANKIQSNFEKYFWVAATPQEGEIRPDLINKRGIYKDCYGASQEWTDFQLRCNFPIAMVAAPELFDPKHAWTALKIAEKHLLGPLGMRTLDPEDWAYCGDYDNSNDSDNPKVANGFNYHQGPEWVWPVGFYLRAKLHFAAANGQLQQTLDSTKTILSRHFTELQTSKWRGLPELTNSNGSFCYDSSRTQAWSMSCILEVLHDLQKIEIEQPLIN